MRSSPKQTENYKKLRSEGASGKHVGDTDARPAPAWETELNPTLAHRSPVGGGLWRPPPDTSPEAGRACAFSTGPRTRCGARACGARARGAARGERSDITGAPGEPAAPIGGRPAGRIPAAVPLRRSAPRRGSARARRGRGGGAGLLRMNRAGAGSALGERVKGSRNMGAATLRQPASLRASDARGSERATRIEATRARVAAVGGVDRGKKLPRATAIAATLR